MNQRDRLRIRAIEVLAQGWGVLKRVTFDQRFRDGTWRTLSRLAYDHGDAACVLPYDPGRGLVLLVRQFRLPIALNGHPEPVIEACAGRLDGDDAATCARKEAEEELGYRLGPLEQAFDVYMSPGADTERMVGFVAPYDHDHRISEGGGLAHEGEDLEVVEMAFDEAYAGIAAGRVVDAKTVMLLQHLKLSGRIG